MNLAPLPPTTERLCTPPKNRLLDCYGLALKDGSYNGYPAATQRLFLDRIPYDNHGHIALPNTGPWTAGNVLPTREEQINEVLHNIGSPKMCELDADYRPLHPWWKDMVQRADIGGVVGKGFFYHWGANYTADAAVTALDTNNTLHLLLIQRRDSGKWALPGGFLEPYEPSKIAAVRELSEEAQLVLDRSNASADKLYAGPVLDIRTTLHAWTETHLWHFMLHPTGQLPPVSADDDAGDAKWFALQDIPVDLYGSHPALIQMVISQISETAGVQAGGQYRL